MRKTPTQVVKILYGECDPKVQRQQASLMERAGYSVQLAIGRKEVEQAISKQTFDVVVLGHSLTRDDRHHLPYKAKKADPTVRVLVIHASGKHPGVDVALDSRAGEAVLLDALSGLLEPAYA